VANFEVGVLQILQAATTLKRLPRMGWLMAGVAAPESVADHTWATALLAMLLADEINGNPAAQGLAQPLDVTRVLRMALVHDLAEAEVTDLPRRTTQLLGKPTKQRVEAAAMAQITAAHPDSAGLVALWEEYSAVNTPEGRLVYDADKLEVVHQALTYRRFGQRNLDEFWQGHRWHYPLCEQLFATLVTAQSVA
jgi:putative hydrolase of HD superfamily